MGRTELAAALRARLDTEPRVGEWVEVTQEMIDTFAAATGDHQWIHTDPERAARESPYGTTVAHGFLTLSLIPRLAGGDVIPEGAALAINYGLNRVRFPAPVPVGSRVRARIRVLAVDEIGDNALQNASEISVEVEGQPKPACVAETLTRYYFA